MISLQSPVLLVLALLSAGALVYLTLQIRRAYLESLTSVKEKSAGLLHFYRRMLESLLDGDRSRLAVYCWVHYVSLHLFPLFCGLAFYLRSDANFLVVILTILWNMQLMQRIFPGPEPTDEEP